MASSTFAPSLQAGITLNARVESPPDGILRLTPRRGPGRQSVDSRRIQVRYCQLLVKPGGGRPHIVRTTRNSAFPLIMRAYPSAAFASGYFSIIGRTPVISAN